MNEAFIVSGARTPIGKFLGGLSALTAPQLGAVAVKEAVSRAGLKATDIEEVIMGNVIQAGVGQAPARQSALGAGLPSTVAAFTVNKVCGSGLKAVMLAAQAIKAGDHELIVAGGMESMSNAPHLLRRARSGWKAGDATLTDAMIHDGLWCAFNGCHMGIHAEHVAKTEKVSRADQDAFSAESHRRAAEAQKSGAFKDEIVPVSIPRADKPLAADEGVRAETTVQSLGALKPVFDKEGSVTAGNASTLSDGAAAVVVASGNAVKRHNLKPMARVVAYYTSGTDPRDLFIAPAFAVEGVLKKAGLGIDDIDLFELNEAFASQMIATARRAMVPMEKTNIHGGAVALGHPIGCSGARVLVTLLYAMKQRGAKRGLASLCLGGGNAVAMIVERV